MTVKSVKADDPYYSVNLKYPQFEGDSAVIKFANEQIASQAEQAMEQFVEAYNDTFPGKKHPKKKYVYTWNPEVSVARPDLVSVYFKTYQDAGQSSPMHAFQSLTYGVVEGEAQDISLANPLVKDVDPLKYLSPIVMADLKRQNAAMVKSGEVKALDEEGAKAFFLTPTALIFVFYSYEYGPYSKGAYEVKIPFADIKSKINPKGPIKVTG